MLWPLMRVKTVMAPVRPMISDVTNVSLRPDASPIEAAVVGVCHSGTHHPFSRMEGTLHAQVRSMLPDTSSRETNLKHVSPLPFRCYRLQVD